MWRFSLIWCWSSLSTEFLVNLVARYWRMSFVMVASECESVCVYEHTDMGIIYKECRPSAHLYTQTLTAHLLATSRYLPKHYYCIVSLGSVITDSVNSSWGFMRVCKNECMSRTESQNICESNGPFFGKNKDYSFSFRGVLRKFIIYNLPSDKAHHTSHPTDHMLSLQGQKTFHHILETTGMQWMQSYQAQNVIL